ncbi:MAG: tail fiber domain-containing protein [Alphaproteobacteria bacterium]|nr:tail fiber domain-containing protein [Alphaproteobacteria bacterium]
MGKSSAPSAPDPRATASAQTSSNIGTAIAQQKMGNINQVTPYGKLTFNQHGTYNYADPNSGDVHRIPQHTATQTFSPQGQQLFDRNFQTQKNLAQLGADQSGRLQGILSKPVDTGGLPDRAAAGDYASLNPGYDSTRVEDALMSRMRPQMDRQRQQLESRLASQGIGIGSEAYTNAMGDFNRAQNDARLAAIAQGGAEQTRQVNTDVARFNAANSARSGALNERYGMRNQPLNEISALMSGSQVQNPNFITPRVGQIANTDVAGIMNNSYNQRLRAHQLQAGQENALIGGMFDLGSSAIAASDRRIKKNLKAIGKTKQGDPIYTFNYKKGKRGIQMGVMAQDIEKRKPSAVVELGGVKHVDLRKAFR